MKLVHPHIWGFQVDSTDIDPFWEACERIVQRRAIDDVIDLIVNYIESPVRDRMYHDIKVSLMSALNRDRYGLI